MSQHDWDQAREQAEPDPPVPTTPGEGKSPFCFAIPTKLFTDDAEWNRLKEEKDKHKEGTSKYFTAYHDLRIYEDVMTEEHGKRGHPRPMMPPQPLSDAPCLVKQYVCLALFMKAVKEHTGGGNGIQQAYTNACGGKKVPTSVTVQIDHYTCDENGFSLGYEQFGVVFKVVPKKGTSAVNAMQEAVDPDAAYMVELGSEKEKILSLPCRPYRYYSRPDSEEVYQRCFSYIEELLATKIGWRFSRGNWTIVDADGDPT